MIELSNLEARVLGVLIEKALSTPEHYPLTVNAIVDGANQKNNRDPVINVEESACFEAVEGLRGKGFAVRVDTTGGRVSKYRHALAEAWQFRAPELSVLGELLLRGPQTLGELRGRASRMYPIESLGITRTILEGLMHRAEPLVKQLAPAPGSRAERYTQLLYADTRASGAPGGESPPVATAVAPAVISAPAAPAASPLADRVDKLEAEVTALKSALRRLAQGLGKSDPLA